MPKPKREQTIILKVTPKEKEAIYRTASRENFSCASDFMRKVLLDRVNFQNVVK